MKSLHNVVFTALVSLPITVLAQTESSATDGAASSDVPAVFPTETRDNPVWRQDDHIHTRPDAVVQRFEILDEDGDRRLQWDEVKVLDMTRHVFETLDTDGSGGLDREEYIAVSPSPENQYTTEAMPEP